MATRESSAVPPEEPLKTVSFYGLLSNNPSQVATLLEACMSDGGFYLDLRDSTAEASTHAVMQMSAEILDAITRFFDLPLEAKLKWEMDKLGELQIGGYKPAGKHSGVVEGKRDGFENFLVPLNALTGLGSRGDYDWPPILAAHHPKFTTFELTCQEIALTLLSTLSKALKASVRVPFEDLHRKEQASTTSLACLKYLPSPALADNQIGHMAHTDVGSLTLLFTSSPGLQIYQRSTSRWLPVTPCPGCIIVNVGDTLNFMSGGVLQSCLHRVIPSSGANRVSETRYSLAFFERPELLARFIDIKGKEWTGEEWHKTKYKLFRAENDQQRETSLLTGSAGFLGGWKESD